MTLDLQAIGRPGPVLERTWTERDTMLYALSVGAGPQSSNDGWGLVAENCRGVELVALPTYAAVLAQTDGLRPPLGDFPGTAVVHAGQVIRLLEPLPPSGAISLSSQVVSIYDKGSGALATSVTKGTNRDSGRTLFETESSVFIRGEGGFGGERGPSSGWVRPDRRPDHSTSSATSQNQALIYRLNGDRNPLHACPETAQKAGFRAPILHGLCTYGMGVRAVLDAWELAPADVAEVEGRFSSPVYPGETLSIDSWEIGEQFLFQVSTAEAGTVIDNGRVVAR